MTKDYKSLRIIFMGTPEFAVASLEALLNAGCNVVAVITAADKPGGRGMQLQQSAVKKFAEEKEIPVLQPEKLKAPDFIEELKSYKADLQIVVAFRMLPEVVWNMPKLGTINLHGSLLPQYRGAAPINRAVMNGETETGVTTFLLQQEIDTGNILLNERIPIAPEETAGELHDRMKQIGAALVVKTVQGFAEGNLEPKPQEDVQTQEQLNAAPKIHTADCEINWENPAQKIYDFIRGLAPYPAAFTFLNGKKLKIFNAEKQATSETTQPGEYKTDGKTFLFFQCTDGNINILELQLEGKKRMTTEEFLRGYRFP